MNRLLSGLPGAGKSYHAAELIIAALKQARIVVTNIPMKVDEVEKLGHPGVLVLLGEDDMSDCDFLGRYPGGFFVLDEVRKWIPSGIQQKQLRPNWDLLLSEHRHSEDWRGRSCEVVLISQCASQLPKCVRTLIDNTTICEKLNKVGLSKCYVGRLYNGPQSLTDQRKVDLVNSWRGKYESSVFTLYESHSKAAKQRSAHAVFLEDGDGGATNIFHSGQAKMVYAGAVAALFSLGYVTHAFGIWGDGGLAPSSAPEPAAIARSGDDRADGGEGGERSESTEPRPDPVARGAVESPRLEDEAPRLSGFWRAGDVCGGWDISGRRVRVTDCSKLAEVRTEPLTRTLSSTSSSSGLAGMGQAFVGLD